MGLPMALLHRLRQRRRYASTVLATFALAWLQMAVAPCLMAGELAEAHLSAGAGAGHGGESDPHAVPTDSAKAVQGQAGAHAHCDYCPPQTVDHDCAEASGDCAYVHDPGLDSRNALKTQLEKFSTHAALLDGSAFGLLRVLREPAVIDLPASGQPSLERSLILENCVQLR